ncbi:hypothetical protein D9M69_482690 [compost metagenome]
MRRGQAVAEQQVGQQQVVDVAAVAGHVDDLVAVGDLLHALDVVDLHALVELVPEPGQHHLDEADHRIGDVRCDLVGVAQGAGFGLLQGDVLFAAFPQDRLAHQRRAQQAFHQRAAMGEVRADHRGLLVAEVHAEDALDHAQRAFGSLALVDQFAQADRRGELHAGLAAEDEDARQLAQPAGDRPVVGEQQLPGALLAVRRLAPEHADRDDLRIGDAVLADRGEAAHQRRRGAALVLAAEPVRFRGEIEEGCRFAAAADIHRFHRARQAGLAAFRIDHRQVAHRGLLEDVEDRLAPIDLQVERGLADGFRAYPEIQQTTQGAETKAAERIAGHTGFFDRTAKRAIARVD